MLKSTILLILVLTFIGCSTNQSIAKVEQKLQVENVNQNIAKVEQKLQAENVNQIEKTSNLIQNNKHYISLSKKDIFLKSFERKYNESYSSQKYTTYLTDKYLVLVTREISDSRYYAKQVLVKLINLDTYEEKNIYITDTLQTTF